MTPLEFFTALCQNKPTLAADLMRRMIVEPTGGTMMVMPCLIDAKDMSTYYREQQKRVLHYILLPESPMVPTPPRGNDQTTDPEN